MNKHHHAALRLFLALAVVGGVFVDSAVRLVTTEYVFRNENLPEVFDGFRIVQLSDLHGAVFGKKNSRLLQLVRRAEPDVVTLTGDLADKETNLADIDYLLTALVEIAPVYYVSGNHEWSEGLLTPLRTLFQRYGVHYLRNEYTLLERDGESLILAGVEDPNGWRDQPTPADVVRALPEGFRILLGHRNYWIAEYPDLPVDLILCGHAHGGVIRLPLLGGILGHHGALFPQYTTGVFTSGRYSMVVSRGLGNTGGVPRFLNNPEIVIVTLRSA